MRTPPIGTSGETLVKEYGLYHLTRLRANKELAEMAGGLEKVQTRLRDKVAAYEMAQASTMTSMAVRDGADAELDDEVRRFALAVLSKTNNNRKSPLYLTYFPDGMAPVVTAPLEAEMQKVGIILSKLGQESDEALKAFAGPLSAAVSTLGQAMDAHRTALDAEIQAFGLVEQDKVNWFDTCRLNYRILTQKFYKDPKKAESFFKPASKGKKEVAAPKPVPAGAGVN